MGDTRPRPARPAPPRRDRTAAWLHRAAGRWVYEDAWSTGPLTREYRPGGEGPDGGGDDEGFAEAVREGARAARVLAELMGERGHRPPAAYLAVLAQDLDGMGGFLRGTGRSRSGRRISADRERHREVSALLGRTAAEQRRRLQSEHVRGAAVYAGGDDLLALVPAAGALEAARTCREAVPEELPTASCAVVFFHHRDSLRQALGQAGEALEAAKSSSPDKHALAVGFIRHSGTTELCVQPWRGALPGDEASPVEDLAVFRPAETADAPRISPRLAWDLERSADALAHPDLPEAVYEKELARLVERHVRAPDTGSAREYADTAARALVRLGHRSRPAPDRRRVPVAEAKVAVFLRQEAR